uniref:Pep_M12B_propep domain-containing protein n=1 Tax=Anopheles albimanus TaxID=7167 RepID=A0A182FMR3_ANOAL
MLLRNVFFKMFNIDMALVAYVFDGHQWAPNMHRTGVFRSKSSKIWDPHPEYKIRAFGMSMHLKLIQDAKFIGKDMKETHVWDNETLRKDEDHLESKQLQACFYKGNVVGDKNSHVRVSLCDGMLKAFYF